MSFGALPRIGSNPLAANTLPAAVDKENRQPRTVRCPAKSLTKRPAFAIRPHAPGARALLADWHHILRTIESIKIQCPVAIVPDGMRYGLAELPLAPPAWNDS